MPITQHQEIIPSNSLVKAIEQMQVNSKRMASLFELPMREIARQQELFSQNMAKTLREAVIPQGILNSINQLPRIARLASIGVLPNQAEDCVPFFAPSPSLDDGTDTFLQEPIITKSISKNETKTSVSGLSLIDGGSFRYRRKILKGISQRNQLGRLLGLMAVNTNNFAADTEIHKSLPTSDIAYIGQVVHRLKKVFLKNGYEAVIERRGDPDGYVLIEIAPRKN